MLIAWVVTPAALAGCGGDSGGASAEGGHAYSVEADTTVTTANIAKARFIPRVNKICRQAWVVILSNFTEYSETQDPKLSKRARFAEAVQLSLMAGIDFHIFDLIYRLGAPPGEERETEKIIGSMQSAVEQGEKRLVPISSVAQVAALFGDYNQRARRYGLDDCLVDNARLRKLKLG
jgi:hypothetical protein